MSQKDIERKQIIFIDYLQELVDNFTTEKFKVKAEYSTNDNDKRVIVVQEQSGQKEVFYGNASPLYNYYMIDIFGLSIQECKNISLMIGNLIGSNIIRDLDTEKWQIMFKQQTNPQVIEYQDIRRVSYNMTVQTVVNKIYEAKDLTTLNGVLNAS